MIITRISDSLKERRRASLQGMALGLDATLDALRDMLAVLERKGRVRRLPSGTPCSSGCNKCHPSNIELYEWTSPT